MDLLILAKSPVPGRVKTRLCPPLEPAEAAAVAEAALCDTIEAACAATADRVVVVLDGTPGPWCPPGVEIVAQETGSFAARLEGAWSHARGPALQIGMDTPQVTAALLDRVVELLDAGADGADTVLGPADDGGWWALAQRRHRPGIFDGVPMSAVDTGTRQLVALRAAGARVMLAPNLRDIDRADDLAAAAEAAPQTRTAALVAALRSAGRLPGVPPFSAG